MLRKYRFIAACLPLAAIAAYTAVLAQEVCTSVSCMNDPTFRTCTSTVSGGAFAGTVTLTNASNVVDCQLSSNGNVTFTAIAMRNAPSDRHCIWQDNASSAFCSIDSSSTPDALPVELESYEIY